MMKNIDYFVGENNNLNRTNYGYFADQSHSNWTLKTPRVGSWNLAKGSYSPDSDKIPLSAWFGSALVVACMFLAMFI
jgi:hypothetical protein